MKTRVMREKVTKISKNLNDLDAQLKSTNISFDNAWINLLAASIREFNINAQELKEKLDKIEQRDYYSDRRVYYWVRSQFKKENMTYLMVGSLLSSLISLVFVLGIMMLFV